MKKPKTPAKRRKPAATAIIITIKGWGRPVVLRCHSMKIKLSRRELGRYPNGLIMRPVFAALENFELSGLCEPQK